MEHRLDIYRRTNLSFSIIPDEEPSKEVFSPYFMGTGIGERLTIKSPNGAQYFTDIYFGNISYTDEVDPEDSVEQFDSMLQLVDFLKGKGFFDLSIGGTVIANAFLDLTDVLFNTFDGQAGKYIQINESATGLVAGDGGGANKFIELLDAPNNILAGKFLKGSADGLSLEWSNGMNVDQNNTLKYVDYGSEGILPGTGNVTSEEVAAFLNARPGGISISEINAPVVLVFRRAGDVTQKQYMFLFGAGKGTWGANVSFNVITPSMIRLISVLNITPDSIIDNPDSEINDLGEIPDGDFVTVANETEWDLSDSGQEQLDGGYKAYYFTYTKDSILYYMQFVGEPGIYGGTDPLNNQFVEGDFVVATNSNVSTTPTLDEVLAAGYQAYRELGLFRNLGTENQNYQEFFGEGIYHETPTGDLEIGYRPHSTVGGKIWVPHVEEEDEFALKSTIPQDLPVDFIVSCTYDSTIDQTESQGKLLTYRIEGVNYTLNLKEVLADKLPVEFPIIKVIHNIAASDINTNRYVISGNILNESGAQGRRFVATLEGRLVDTKWVIEKTDFIVLSGYLNNSFHGHTVIGDNIYYMPRYTSTSTQNRILRFNMSNLADNKTLIFPLSAPYIGNSTNIDNHEGNVYLFITTSSSNPVGAMVKVSGDLNYYETLFTIDGNDTDTGIRAGSYFIIDKDEIMIPTVNDVNDTYEKYHSIGLSVYTMNGELKRKKVGMDLNLGYDPTSQPLSHWIGMFNNKMIISYSNGSSGESPLRLVRLDVGYENNNNTIILEESVWSFGTTNFTNDNSIDSKGYLYLNPEGVATEKWYKVYYSDFTDVEEIASNYWSLGSPLPKNKKTSEKTKLSQFGEWNKVTQSVSVNGGTPYVADPFTGNINITAPAGETNLTYTAAPTYGTVNSDTGTDATISLADNTNAGLMPANFYVVYPETTYTETVTWGGTAPVTMQNSTWQATKIGNRLSLRMNINYATAGAGNTTAQVPLPTGVPLPSSITGFTGNNSYVAVGSASVSTGITSNHTISRAVLRRETGTSYSVYNSFSSGAYNTIIIDIEYFTD